MVRADPRRHPIIAGQTDIDEVRCPPLLKQEHGLPAPMAGPLTILSRLRRPLPMTQPQPSAFASANDQQEQRQQLEINNLSHLRKKVKRRRSKILLRR